MARKTSFYYSFLVLPPEQRRAIIAVWDFCRAVDDAVDEEAVVAGAPTGRAAVAFWREELARAFDGREPATDVARRLQPLVAAFDLPRQAFEDVIDGVAMDLDTMRYETFDDLVSAFGQDTMTTRYASWSDVFDYCRRSANPVGRLVLRIAGHRDEALDRSSDALCTALQLANFWQDFGRDWRSGRLYVPRDVQASAGASERELVNAPAGPLTRPWASALEQCVVVTQDQFAAGRAVCDGVGGRLRYELRLTWLGGQRILERVDRARQELLTYRPTLGGGDVPVLLWRALRWQKLRCLTPESSC